MYIDAPTTSLAFQQTNFLIHKFLCVNRQPVALMPVALVAAVSNRRAWHAYWFGLKSMGLSYKLRVVLEKLDFYVTRGLFFFTIHPLGFQYLSISPFFLSKIKLNHKTVQFRRWIERNFSVFSYKL